MAKTVKKKTGSKSNNWQIFKAKIKRTKRGTKKKRFWFKHL